MAPFTIRPLSPATWGDFAALAERHNGVWGGCWCLAFHAEGGERGAQRRARKEQRVREGMAHAALVYLADTCIGWCQFGSPEELPRIKHRKAYDAGLESLPDWRITCLFVDKDHRGEGVAEAAVAGALALIAGLGGGLVESYPEDVTNRKVSASFLHNGTLALFERLGFARRRPLGAHHWVVEKQVESSLS